MDVAASIIAVIQISGKVISVCHHYITTVKDCPNDLRAILVETSSLKAAVENLEFLYNNTLDPNLKALYSKLAGNDGPMTGSKACLKRLEELLPKETTSAGGSKKRSIQPTLACLAWPLQENRAKKLIDELGRYRSAITLALTADLTRTIQRVDTNVVQIHDKLEANTRREIIDWLVTTDPSPLYNANYALHDENTGLWLQKCPEYLNWKAGNTPLIWFYGIPGAGKTVLLSYMVHDVESQRRDALNDRSICVYYYCYFGHNQDETDPLLEWMLSQLCRHAAYVPVSISDSCRLGRRVGTSGLLDAIAETCLRFTWIYFLIDAVDESKDRYKILRALQLLRSDRFANIKVLVMSRDYSDIRYSMEKSAALMVSLSNSFVDEDIAIFVRNEISNSDRLRRYHQSLKEEIRSALVIGAHGMFRWVVCQIDVLSRLHTAAEVREALNTLPEGLDETYKQILLKIPISQRRRAKTALMLIARGDETAGAEVLAEAVMVNTGDYTYDENDRMLEPVETLQELCTCLITFYGGPSEYSFFCLAHYTVKEFLRSNRIKDSEASYFGFSSNDADGVWNLIQLVYLHDISYSDVPSVDQFAAADKAERDRMIRAVDCVYPLLDECWVLKVMHSAHQNAKARQLVMEIIESRAPYHLLWTYGAFPRGNEEAIAPWFLYYKSGAATALVIASWFGLSWAVQQILEQSPGLLCEPEQMASNPLMVDSFAPFGRDIQPRCYQHSEFDMHLSDCVPQGNLLDATLRIASKEILRTILQYSPTLEHYVNDYGLSALSLFGRLDTLKLGCWETVYSENDCRIANIKMLLSAGAAVNAHPVSETPLQSAVMLNEYDTVALLIDSGALVNEIADDVAVVGRIGRYLGNGDRAKAKAVAVERRGHSFRYRTPLRIACDALEDKGVAYDPGLDDPHNVHHSADFGVADALSIAKLLHKHGGLSLHLFPHPDLTGYVEKDWKRLEAANWYGVRSTTRPRSK